MSTSYPGVTAKAGDTVSFDLDFTSLTEESYDASLSAVSIPEGWEGTFTGSDRTISKIHIDGNAVSSSDSTADSSAASFDLSIPDDAADGTYAVALKADAGSGVEDTLNLEIIVSSEAAGQGNFTSEYAEQQGSTGTTFSFDTTLINNRGTEQSYSLSSSAPSGWSVSYTPSSSEDGSQVASVTVDAESSEGLTVTVTPPENVEQGEYTISCTATSANESLTTDLIVEITGTYGVSLSTPAGNLNADAYAGSETSVAGTCRHDRCRRPADPNLLQRHEAASGNRRCADEGSSDYHHGRAYPGHRPGRHAGAAAAYAAAFPGGWQNSSDFFSPALSDSADL